MQFNDEISGMKKLAIISTHPIQYYAPIFFQLLSKEIELKVFYTAGEQSLEKNSIMGSSKL